MKNTTRVIIALLILAMTLPMVLACAETGQVEETTLPAATESPTSVTAETTAEETLFAPSSIPDDLKFEGTALKLLYWDDVPNLEFFAESDNGEPINDAIYKRNAKVEEQFGVTLEFIGTPGDNGNRNKYINVCVNNVMSGADAYDIFCGYSMTGSSLMTEGIIQDLTDYEIFDFEKPWWPESLISKATIKGGVYFVSGDISTNFLYMMYLCIFNKDLFSSVNQAEPKVLYDLVHNGEWTIDKLIEYTSGTYLDLDGDQAASEGDRFGLAVTSVHFDSFYTGSDLTTVNVNEDGDLVMSSDIFSEKTVDLLEKVCGLLHTSGDSYTKEGVKLFAENNVLFVIDRPTAISSTLTSVDFPFGILPIPKYNAEQEGYKTCLSFPYTMYMISTAANNPEASAAVIELMAYQSYVGVTPILFEETMKARYADQSDDAFMFDYIRDGVVIDVGRLFTNQLSNMSYEIFRKAVSGNNAGGYMSTASKYTKTFNVKIKDINDSLDNLK